MQFACPPRRTGLSCVAQLRGRNEAENVVCFVIFLSHIVVSYVAHSSSLRDTVSLQPARSIRRLAAALCWGWLGAQQEKIER